MSTHRSPAPPCSTGPAGQGADPAPSGAAPAGGEETPPARPEQAAAWLALVRPGDWLVAGLAAVAVAASFPLIWQGGAAEKAVVRHEGRVVAELDLSRTRRFSVEGALGATVIAVEPGRARVAADPGPRQYCVRQGWLTRPGEIAICAPNRISLQIAGQRSSGSGFDSLAY